MRDPNNIDAVCASMPDYIGFIFYPKSSRFVGKAPDETIFARVPKSTQKVGVFVNETAETVLATCLRYRLQGAQLHGHESPAYCLQIKRAGFTVIKAFSVAEDFNFTTISDYEGAVDFFLFDTKGKLPGGTGQKFDWSVLHQYELNTPFFLSGGIRLHDSTDIKALNLRQLYAADINSGFEIEPALKDANQVATFIQQIRN
ncbi:phosphoribosylanthranilate isomerase [Mangrovibacterium marinum]|uniref:N-(5'-phosphoribosyl)anthranilate isomerase n=2 Tax=Mangrovibacterium marinum TaxID=1639118 RepID=A0A2T5C0Z6_9BACT|nr:phosphoribosylanthranilate isomerase [Mangrovibacterium marinum]